MTVSKNLVLVRWALHDSDHAAVTPIRSMLREPSLNMLNMRCYQIAAASPLIVKVTKADEALGTQWQGGEDAEGGPLCLRFSARLERHQGNERH